MVVSAGFAAGGGGGDEAGEFDSFACGGGGRGGAAGSGRGAGIASFVSSKRFAALRGTSGA